MAAIERARLSLFLGDCDTAGATLRTLSGVKSAAALGELAKACSRATAGSVVVEDKAHGLWVRLQDVEDRVLVPILADVAARALAAIEHDLGIVMPRPLRIDLVRDLFSLSAVSGLPLQAAETTGTVAVARWGRVNMISPRAAPGGYPWEDTLAHEITHLALSRATRDMAPLWLQEGLAKRQEIRWRASRPFDGEPPVDWVARNALVSGESVGVDKLGPSIAMLPSADAATIAFAEVTSFVGYFAREKGRSGLKLLFADLRGMGPDNSDAALRSTSGYDLAEWIRLWQSYLLSLPETPRVDPTTQDAKALARFEEDTGVGAAERLDARARSRAVRLGELFFAGAASGAVTGERAFLSDTGDATMGGGCESHLAEKKKTGALLFESLDADRSSRLAACRTLRRHVLKGGPGLAPGRLLRHGRSLESVPGTRPAKEFHAPGRAAAASDRRAPSCRGIAAPFASQPAKFLRIDMGAERPDARDDERKPVRFRGQGKYHAELGPQE